MGILRGARDLNFVPAPARYLRHQRSGLSAAEKKDVHEVKTSYSQTSRRKSAKSAKSYA
jgi:hypothetical protein